MITRFQFLSLVFLISSSFSAMGQSLLYSTHLDRAYHVSNAELLVENPKETGEVLTENIFKKARPTLIYGREDRSDIVGEYWSYRITYNLSYQVNNIPIGDGQLLIQHRADDGVYEAIHDYALGDLSESKIKMVITNIEASVDDFTTVITDPIVLAEIIPEDIRLELRLEITEYDFLPTNVSMAFLENDEFDADKDNVEVRWGFFPGADFYELEWAYIDAENLDYTELTLPTAEAAIFKNATKVEVYGQHYKIPLSYPEGRVFYRVRPVGRFTENINGDYSHLRFGLWSANGPIEILTGFQEDFNWQFTSTFAEEGKYKKVISYFDDGLRNRQTQTNLSTEEVSLVATAHYDVEGRPTVNVLPVPAIDNNDLFYKPKFNRSATDNQTYNRKHFDKGLQDFCNGTPSDQLSASLNGDGLGGAGYYFSPSYGNDVTAPGIHKAYLPDAEGYPMTQVRYLNDGTGRLAYQSGVGEFYQLGNGKETRYFYDDPSEMQLHRLFGSNVGDAKYYKRNVVMDANGQMSVSYIDAAGRVIATALTGVVSNNVNALESAETAAYNVEENLLANNIKDDANGISKTISTILNEQADQTATFHYSFTGTNNTVTIGNGEDNEICISCIYELSINVYSPCGNNVDIELVDDTDGDGIITIGNYDFCEQVLEDYIVDFTVVMEEVGLYRIEKILKVIQPDIAAIEALVADLLPTINDINVPINYVDCANTCYEYCYLTLEGSTIEEIEACIASCEQSGEALINLAITGSCNYLLHQMYNQISPDGCLFNLPAPWWDETRLTGLENPISLPVEGSDPIIINTQADAITNFLDASLWEDGWEEAIVVLHPEYCHYLLCSDSDPSRQFDYDFGRMEDWDGIIWNAFTWANVQLIVNDDPMFSSGLGFYPNYESNSDLTTDEKDLIEDVLEGLSIDVTDNVTIGLGLNALFLDRLEDFAICTPVEGLQNIVLYINSCLSGSSGDPNLTDEEKWRFFKSLYLGEKLKLQEELRRPWCPAGSGVCALTEDHELFDVPSPAEGNSDATEEAINNYTDANSVDMCAAICASRVEEWIQTILIEYTDVDDANPGLNCGGLSDQDIADIRVFLSNYCFDNCNSGNPLAYLLDEEIAELLSNVNNDCVDIIINNLAVPFDTVYECYDGENANTVDPCIASMFVELNAILDDPLVNCENDIHTPTNTGCFSEININGDEIYLTGSNLCCDNLILSPIDAGPDVTICTFDYFGAPWTDGTSIFVNAYTVDPVHGTLTITPLAMTCFSNNYQENYAPDLLGNNLNDCIINTCIAIPIEEIPPLDNCIEQLIAENITIREFILNEEINSIFTGVVQELDCDDYTEVFTVSYPTREHHYTLYYYDQAGNLVQTVPPAGVNPLTAAAFTNGVYDETSQPTHNQQTRYRYNTLGQVVWQYSPDGDEVNFKYDYAQRLRISQNGRQRVNANNTDEKISYTKYDPEGRITEVGELNNLVGDLSFDGVTEEELNDPTFPLLTVHGQQDDVTITEYNSTEGDNIPGFVQSNTRSRVARTFRYKLRTDAFDDLSIETRYSYDEHGNVDKLRHDMNSMGGRSQRIDYQYDLISGNVKEVAYQQGEVDEFYHRYEYDADNRLTRVFTSEDDIIWDQDACYQYYMHGPLARVEIGHDKIQGTDYYYTLQGWIKGVNMPGHNGHQIDPGEDGHQNEHSWIARDAMAYGLGYYEGDYNPIGSGVNLGAMSSTTWTGFENDLLADIDGTKGLFNGNISWMLTDIPSLDQSTATKEGLRGMAYQYDQLHRIQQAKSYGATAAASSGVNWNYDGFYDTNYTYDPNGNLNTLQRNTRNGNQVALMDNLTYNYDNGAIPNRLSSVTEGLVDVIPNDPSVTSQPNNNYTYDDIGNLIGDDQQGVEIEWDVYGKVKEVTFTDPAISIYTSIAYEYDAAGNRIAKHLNRLAPDLSTVHYYIRDASGNIMSIYEQGASNTGINIHQKEVSLYGSSRLGQRRFTNTERMIPHPDEEEVVTEAPFTAYVRNRGSKIFECSNHLGNVLTVVTDKKVGFEIDDPIYLDDQAEYYLASVVSTSDYYPFGFQMPDRTVQSGEYRYGFNGKEKDENGEFGSQAHYDYGFRIYNPGIGKFLSVDPLTKKFPFYTPYQFAGNKPIIAIDLDGLEDLIMVNSRVVGNDIRSYIEKNGLELGIERLYKHDYLGKYPDGVVGREYADKGDHTWLNSDRGANIDIPNLVATHESVISLDPGETMLLTLKDDDIDKNVVHYHVQIFEGQDLVQEGDIAYSPEGGLVVFGDGTSGYDLDLSWAATNEKGNYDAIDWGTSMPGGGGADWTGSGFLTGMKMAVGLIKRYFEIKSTLDPNNEDLGSGSAIPDEPEPEPSFYPMGFEPDIDVKPRPTKGTDTVEVKGKYHFTNGKRDSTARGKGRYERTTEGTSQKTKPLQTEKAN